MNFLVEYIAAALLNSANHSGNSKARLSSFIRDDYEIYRGSINKILHTLQSQFGPHIFEFDVENALQLLSSFAAAESGFSPAAKSFWNIKFDNFRYYFIESEPEFEDDKNEYATLRHSAAQHPILMAYARNGSAYIEDAIEHIAQMGREDVEELRSKSTVPNAAPASDRMVTLNHNQQIELEQATTQIIEAVEKQNGIDGDQTLRQQLVGQLKAGRELVRVGVFKVILIQGTLMNALESLVRRYEKEFVGALAAALLTELAKLIVG